MGRGGGGGGGAMKGYTKAGYQVPWPLQSQEKRGGDPFQPNNRCQVIPGWVHNQAGWLAVLCYSPRF